LYFGFSLIQQNAVAGPDNELIEILGQKRAQLLAKLGYNTRVEALLHLPSRYEDRRNFQPLTADVEGQFVTWKGKIAVAKTSRWRGGRFVFEVTLAGLNPKAGGTELLVARWYNVYYLPKVLTKGREVILHGKLMKGKQGWAMLHPEFEFIEDDDRYVHLNRIVPVYPLTEGVSQRVLRRILYDLSQAQSFAFPEDYPAPAHLPRLEEAIPRVHFPETMEQQRAARRRIVFDEFFRLQCVLAQRRWKRQHTRKTRAQKNSTLAEEFLAALPFALTRAQERVIGEIRDDLRAEVPMNRLLQGDVGAGKTVVAVYAMLLSCGQGKQAGLMAPTEILAEQHYRNIKKWMEPLGVRVGLLTGSKKMKAPPTDELPLECIARPDVGSIIIGTHALLFDDFAAERLGLIVIDEQHKFGVLQRQALALKGDKPDVLVMTATPIPRTLGLTLYGDLDVSVLDELPPGRQRIITACRSGKDLPKVWDFAKTEVAAGRQVYVVYPLVEESDKVEAKAVQKEFETIRKIFAPHKVGLLHGRLKPEEKEAVMAQFRANSLSVLVSTLVIEVGVDVPNATIMVIENAERFGLAQLHQLRGRIGRGSRKSYCVLIGEPKSLEGWKRLKIMEETNDGFRIAEEDFKIRGPGNIFGTEQSGLPPLRWGNLVTDLDLLQEARQLAEKMVGKDPKLESLPLLRQSLKSLANNLAGVG
jgi:ATP-dependent DNA helicase RecG